MSDMNSTDVHILKQVLVDLLSVKDLPNLSHVAFACFSVSFKASTYSQYEQMLNELDALRIADNGCKVLNSLLCLLFNTQYLRFVMLYMVN